jgi:hypothetical protein
VKARLPPEWRRLLGQYHNEHRDRCNQLTHVIGIRMIAASLPLAMTIVGWPAAVGSFALGSGFPFAGIRSRETSRHASVTANTGSSGPSGERKMRA